MKLAIAHHITSFEALDRQFAFEKISDDPENYHRCVARERTQEIDTCHRMGIPCFLILDTQDTRSIRITGRGSQNTLRKHLLFNLERQPVESLSEYKVLARASVGHEKSVLDYIETKGGVNIADWPSQERTLEWYKYVKPEYLKRRLAYFRVAEALRQDLGEFRDSDGRFFAKTSFKAISGLTNSLLDLLGYEVELMPPTAEVIVSELLEILSDERGKREYRCFVVRNDASSISRYIDYKTDYEIPREVEAFAESFVISHQGIVPDCYVLDVAETDRGVAVIELNGIVASGRYERNNFAKLLVDLTIPGAI